MTDTYVAVRSAKELAERIRSNQLTSVEEVKQGIEEVVDATGQTPYLVTGLARDHLRVLMGTADEGRLLTDAVRLFPVKAPVSD